MKPLPFALAACVALAACSPQYRNGAVRPTVPETLVGAHAAPNAKAAPQGDAESKSAPAAKPSGNPK
ncbi:MAG TPA: hypothetical protein VFI81_12530 [Rhodanobacteraceae bacterium]|nr:hypothetical protein [Rhodanobacteraceae bacterium]